MDIAVEIADVEAKITNVEARTSVVRAMTASVMVLTELACMIGILMGIYYGSALNVVGFGFILLGAVLGQIQISLTEASYKITKALRESD